MFRLHRMDMIVALYIFGVLTAELLGSKTFPLASFDWLHLNASVAIFALPLVFTLVDVVTEVYGRERARSMMWSGLVIIGLVIAFLALATTLPPSNRFAPTEAAYDKIFHASIQISIASLVAFASSQLLDIAVFSKLKRAMHGRALWLRNNVSNFLGQSVDTVIFITLAFWAFDKPFAMNTSFLIGLIIPYWLIKCALSVLQTPLVYAGVWWLKGDKKSRA